MPAIKIALVFTEQQLLGMQQLLGREDIPPAHWQLADELTELVNSGVDALEEAKNSAWQRPLDEMGGYHHDG
jgi:hypothetical protein